MQLTTINLTQHATLTIYHQTWFDQQQVPAMVIIPGGSMKMFPVESTEKLALAWSAQGYQVAVLRYTLISDGNDAPLYPQPLIDLAQAVHYLRTHQTDLHLNDQVFLNAFSAGGHLGALYNNYWATTWLREQSGLPTERLQPTGLILGYPVINLHAGFPADQATLQQWTTSERFINASDSVNLDCAPTFIWTTLDDPFVPASNSLQYFNALYQAHVPVEGHFYPHGPHGMTLATPNSARKESEIDPHVATWFKLAYQWIDNRS